MDTRIDDRPASWLALFVRATNLLDRNDTSEYGFPDPGHEVWPGARFRVARADTSPK
jgi:hypothetical protein